MHVINTCVAVRKRRAQVTRARKGAALLVLV
jgi:hypothetical protein